MLVVVKKGAEDKENECKDTKGAGDVENKDAYDSQFVEDVGDGD